MTLTKFASATIIDAKMASSGLMRTAHRHEFDYEPKTGFLYVRSRAISSRTNDNFDHFPAAEIKKAYRTFIGKPVFVNHHNENHRRARGVIVDAALHEDINADGSEDTWAEVLMEVDAINFPKLAQAIIAGEIDRTSMGTDVEYSVCSICNNKASSPVEYCSHIPRSKGMKVRRTTASGAREDVLCYEKCYGLGFFENSLLVEEPADPTAYFLGVDTRGVTAKTAGKVAAVPDYLMESYYRENPSKRPVGPNAAEYGEGVDLLNPDLFVDDIVRWEPDLLSDDSGYSRRDLLAVGSRRTAETTLAPAKVDTLRDSACPVCGESDSYDGDKCRVCNFIRPPDEFADPDLSKAKENDLRQEQVADGEAGAVPGAEPVVDPAAEGPDYLKKQIPVGGTDAPAGEGSGAAWKQRTIPKDSTGETGEATAETPLWKQKTRRKSA